MTGEYPGTWETQLNPRTLRGKRQDPTLKRLTSWMFYKVFNYLSGMKYDPEVGNFRIISRKVVESYCSFREQLRFFGGLVEWMGFSTASIDVRHAERHEGKSTYTVYKLVKLAAETIIAYSDRPLRIAVKLGFLMSAVAIVFGSYILYRAVMYDSPVLGWSSLIVSIYFIGGIIIGILGIIGIYLGKTYDETKKRPLYIISERVGL